jgi:hypothetical protein
VQKVPQWYGETVGFWNGNTLVSWTANVQGWTLSHSMFEFSNKMETIEVFTPSADGKTITVDATFYDPEAFTRPLHTVTPWERTRPPTIRSSGSTFVECRVQSTIVNGPDGRPTQTTFVDEGYIDYFGRPWAQNWESISSKAGRNRRTDDEENTLRRDGPRVRNRLRGDGVAGAVTSLVRDVQHGRLEDDDRKLTRFIPGSNHAQLIFEVLNPDGTTVMQNGKPLVWGMETGSAAAMARNGVTVESFPVGTIMTVTLHPLRDGRPMGAVGGSIVFCGTKMPAGGCTEKTGKVMGAPANLSPAPRYAGTASRTLRTQKRPT